MSTKTESSHTAEFLVSEAPGTRSRDQVTVTVPANTTLRAGHVLAKLTATGKYVPYDNAGADGSESAAGVLYEELINGTGGGVDMLGVVVNTDAEIRTSSLQWTSGLTDNDKAAGLVDLLALGIKARS